MAGEGLPLYVWNTLATAGESAWDIGLQRARRKEGGFSYRNAIVRTHQDKVVACLIGYPLEEDPEPIDYMNIPPMFTPLQQLEDSVPGSWYVNVLATYPLYRGRGFGTALLEIAEQLAREALKQTMSVIVSDANPAARRLYERHGYTERDTRPMVKDSWDNPGQNWILLTKTV